MKNKSYRVIKSGARIEGVRYATPSIIRLKPSVARYHLGRKNIKEYKRSRK